MELGFSLTAGTPRLIPWPSPQPSRSSVVSTELDRVRAAIARASDAMGGTLLLAGEEGIGKSRLAGDALVLARRRGFLTLKGTAYALHTHLANAPVLEAIGPFLADLPADRLGQLVGVAERCVPD